MLFYFVLVAKLFQDGYPCCAGSDPPPIDDSVRNTCDNRFGDFRASVYLFSTKYIAQPNTRTLSREDQQNLDNMEAIQASETLLRHFLA